MGDNASLNTHELRILIGQMNLLPEKTASSSEFCDIKTFEYNVKRKFHSERDFVGTCLDGVGVYTIRSAGPSE
jgi:hypothetical protein